MYNVPWEAKEDKIIDDYIKKNNSKSNAAITRIIEGDRPEGIQEERYKFKSSLYQHVALRKRIMKGVA